MPGTLSLTLFAVKVLLLAGGVEAKENHHSHRVHLLRAQALFEARGVPAADVQVFWADGEAPGPDRAVVPEAAPEGAWLLEGTRLATELDPGPELAHTPWPGARPAKRGALRQWLEEIGPSLSPGDTLLIAVTDHGQPDPQGGPDTRISLWGEALSVEQLARDLDAVPEDVRVQLWMSQCYSGGFADLRHRPNTCGAFSTTAERVAYGCYPQLAARTDVGHFLRLLEGLERAGHLAGASDDALLHDDAPDAPHLTSDAFLFEQLSQAAQAAGAPLDTFLDDRLAAVDPAHPAWRLVAQASARYGLGRLAGYGDVLRALDRVAADRYAAEAWLARWEHALHGELKRLAEPVVRKLRPLKARDAKVAARGQAVQALQAALAADPDRASIVQQRAQVDRLHGVLDRLDLQEAALLRTAYLFGRMAGPAVLDAAGQRHLDELRRCEASPLFLPDPGEPTPEPRPLAPLSQSAAVVESARPAWLGLEFRDRRKGVVEVTGFTPGGPAQASALQIGDRILAVGRRPLAREGDLRRATLAASVGGLVPLQVRRGRQTLTVPVVAAPAPLPPAPPGLDQVVPPLALQPLEPGAPLPALGEGTPSLLFFWDPACKPCKRAAPHLAGWARARGAQVLAITGAPLADVQRFLKQARQDPAAWPFEVLLDPTGEAARLLVVEQTPTFAFVDAQRRLAAWGVGFEGEGPEGIPLDVPLAASPD